MAPIQVECSKCETVWTTLSYKKEYENKFKDKNFLCGFCLAEEKTGTEDKLKSELEYIKTKYVQLETRMLKIEKELTETKNDEEKIKENIKKVEEWQEEKEKKDNEEKEKKPMDCSEVPKLKQADGWQTIKSRKAIYEFRQMTKKAEELERIEKNIVMLNVPEGNDETVVKEILNVLDGMPPKSNNILPVERWERIGRSVEGRNRPIRVIYKSKTDIKEVLLNKRELRFNEHYKKVYVDPEKTKDELYQMRKLREELHRRREAGEDELVIYRNEIVHKSFFQNKQTAKN